MNASVIEESNAGSRIDCALLVLRLASAIVFLYHGSAILFGAFGGPGPEKFAGFLHAPVIVGCLVGLAQFCGGLAMLTGIFIRIGAVCIIIVMLGAISWFTGSTGLTTRKVESSTP